MKTKNIPSTLIALLVMLFNQGFSQPGCNPCTQPFARYLADIYAEGWGPVYNVPYTTELEGSRTLDFYGYVDECAQRPLVIILPGSGFLPGGNIKIAPNSIYTAEYFARKGYAVAVVDYHREKDPCANQSKMNSVVHEAAQDVNAAIQYLLGSAVSLKIDPHNIFVIGESAGGIAGLSAIFSGLDGNLLYDELQPTNIGYDHYALNVKTLTPYKNLNYTIKAFAGISTAVVTEGIFDNRVRNRDIPMIFAHGNLDMEVPFDLDYPNSCSNGSGGSNLANPFCGSGCIVDKIVNDPANINCYKLNEVKSNKHNLMAFPVYQSTYMNLVRDFFYEMLYCLPCSNYHHIYPGPPVPRKPAVTFGSTKTKKSAITIYPNPADTKIIFKGIEENSFITFTDLTGKVVLSKMLNENARIVDISALEVGVYLVSITSKGITTAEKVMVR